MNLPSIAIHLHHNASAAVYYNNDVVCVVEVERLVNIKNASFEFFEPLYCKPYILESIYNYFKEKFNFTKYDKFILGQGFEEFPAKYKEIINSNHYIIDTSHHSAHAANSFYQSPYNEAIIVSFDGGSNDGWFRIFLAKRNEEFQCLHEAHLDLGSHYHVFGSLCEEIHHYNQLTAAGKVLGLQSYGNVVAEWKPAIREFFTYIPYWKDLDERIKKMSNKIGIQFSKTQKLLGNLSYNLTRTAQEVFEELFFENAHKFIERYSFLPIVLTGGCALNITLNTLVKNKYQRDVFIAPNSSDCGLSVGLLCKHFKPAHSIDITYKGIEPLDKQCLLEYVNERKGKKLILDELINDLANDKIVGVVQGNSEHGPRALGNRSIICSPLSANMKDTLNAKVKHREWYRPFAPIVRLQDVEEYFEWHGESRWMNFCAKVKSEYIEKLAAITHIDQTARLQTITEEQNPFMYKVLTHFKEKTGIGVLVNTSFNVDQKPILSTYKDAFKVLDETQLDKLYLDGFYFSK